MKNKVIFLLVWCLVFFPCKVFAGGAVARRRQMEKQAAVRKKMIEEQAKVYAQQRARAMAQQRAQVIAQQQAQVIAQQKAQAIAYQRAAIQHQVASQIQNIKQINLHQPAVEGLTMDLEVQAQAPSPQVKAVATLDEVVSALEQSSQDWDLIIDKDAKEMVVVQYIEQYRQKGIIINNSSSVYAEMINGMAQESPEMLNLPFAKILMVAAIMQYDFNNGEDKDALALKILGSYDAVKKNKERLGL